MKRLLLLLLFLPIIGYSQYPGTWFRASQWVNSPMYQLNGVNLDSANTVKRGFFTKYQYNKLQSKENNLGNPSVNGYVLSSTTNGVRSWVASSLNQYPNSGIALSTGSGWGSSITDNSANWNAAYGWGNWASNFGTTVGTIAQGNDSRITNGQTAFGWGNHASAGYELQANKTTSISSASTDVQYPSAKSVYTLSDLKADQFPGISAETPIGSGDISINYSTRVLTITPPLGYFDYFTDGNGLITKRTVTGSVSFPAWSDVSGTYYLYFDGNGVAQTISTSIFFFDNVAPVYRILWNSTLTGSAKSAVESIETHLNTTSGVDHQWKHRYGVIWETGFDMVSNTITTGNPNADGRNSVVALTTGTNMDDNLAYTITNSTSGLTWNQNMGTTTPATLNATNSGLFEIRTQDGSGNVSSLTPTRFPFAFNASNTPQFIKANGTKTDVTDGDFFVYYLYAIQDPRSGEAIKLVSDIVQYDKLSNSEASTWSTLQAAYVTLNDAEIRPLYRLVFEYRATYNVGAKKAALREVTDIRKAIIGQSTAAIGSVNASSVVSVPSGGLSATNVQNALNELDNEKIGGSGTVGTIPLFTGTAAIGNSPITVIGSNITSVVTQKTTADYESAGLGAELLTSAGWTSTDWTGSFGTGFAHTVGNTTSLTNTLAAVVGNSYQITYTVTGRTAGTFTVTFGGQSNNGLSATGNYGPKATTVGGLTIAPTSDFNGTIIISIKLISPYLPFYSIQDNTGASSFEVRNSTSSLGNAFSGVGAGRMNTTGIYNNFQGSLAGYSNTTGANNNFQGAQAGQSNTTGTANNFQGSQAGQSNTTGGYNNFQGYRAGYWNTTGNYNNFQGFQAGYSNTTGYVNNFQGYQAGYSNTTGGNNNFQGYLAGYSNTTGNYNNFQGYRAGYYIADGVTANTTSDYCNLIGDNTRVLADNDQNEIVIGSSAIGHGSNTATWGSTATTAHYFTGNISVSNTSTGVSGGYSNSATGFTQTDGFRLGISSIGIAQLTQYENLGLEVYTNSKRAMRIDSLQNARFFGSVISATAGATTSQAGTTQLSNSYSGTSEVLAVTEKALKDGLASVGTSIAGETNAVTLTTKVGIDAGLNENETAERDNCFYGYQAGYSNTTGSNNNFQGDQAGYSNTTGNGNNFQGTQAGYYNTTGASNNFQCYSAGYSNTTGNSNNFQGAAAGYSNTTGSYNNFQGYQAGRKIADGITENTTSSYCNLIGDNTRVLADNDQNEIVIGSSAIGHGSNTATWGNTATTAHYFVGAVKVNGSYNFGSDAGSTDDYTVTIDGITSYTVGMVIYFKANSPNAGACTINVSSLGAKSLKMKHDQDPSDNFIEAGSIVQAVYDGTNFQMMQPNAN